MWLSGYCARGEPRPLDRHPVPRSTSCSLVIGWPWLCAVPLTMEGAGLRVGLVFDIGGKNDKSFNRGGVARDQRDTLHSRRLGVQVRVDRARARARIARSALRTLAAKKVDLVIGVGFIFGPDLERLARQFPDVKFAGVDYSPSEGIGTLTKPGRAPVPRAREAAFWSAAIAGLLTRSNGRGFVGGMKIRLSTVRGGVRGRSAPMCARRAAWSRRNAGTEPKAFADPSLGQELASGAVRPGRRHHLSRRGQDRRRACSRRSGSAGLRAIGVDSISSIRRRAAS